VSVGLHGKTALEESVNIDTTVQEKAITYPVLPKQKQKQKVGIWGGNQLQEQRVNKYWN